MERLAVLGRWPVHSPALSNVLSAARQAEQSNISFWDAMIIESARAMGCSILWSEDLNSGQKFGTVTVRDPFRRGS